jgi:hypothetical protein
MTITASVQLENKNSGRESQATCRQDELIGGKPDIRKVTLTLTQESFPIPEPLWLYPCDREIPARRLIREKIKRSSEVLPSKVFSIK